MPTSAPNFTALANLSLAIEQVLDPKLLKAPYSKQWSPDNPTLGFCSIAAEAAFFILGGKPAGWQARAVRDADGTSHWWLEHEDGTRYDPTGDQYRQCGRRPPYERGLTGRAVPFMGMRSDPDNPWGLGRRSGKRAQALLDRILEKIGYTEPLDGAGARFIRRKLLAQGPRNWEELRRWSAHLGVTLELEPNFRPRPGALPVVYLSWIQRDPHAPAGNGAAVIKKARDLAYAKDKTILIECLEPALVPFYQGLDFQCVTDTQDPQSGAVRMQTRALTAKKRTRRHP